jgi:hypothetical protein
VESGGFVSGAEQVRIVSELGTHDDDAWAVLEAARAGIRRERKIYAAHVAAVSRANLGRHGEHTGAGKRTHEVNLRRTRRMRKMRVRYQCGELSARKKYL